MAQNTDYFFSSSLHFVGNVLGNAVFLFLLYRLVPNCHVSLLHAVSGALIIGLLLETAKYGFGIYISHFNSYAPVYGGFSIIPIFLVWLNLLWLIILSGALVIACIGDWHSQQDEMQRPDHVFNQVIAILLLLAEAQQQGKTTTIRTIHQKLAIDRGQIETLLLRLAEMQYVAESKRGWLLETSPEQIWLSDLFRHFVYRDNALPHNALLNERIAECCQPLFLSQSKCRLLFIAAARLTLPPWQNAAPRRPQSVPNCSIALRDTPRPAHRQNPPHPCHRGF